jgi:hypothetical protein
MTTRMKSCLALLVLSTFASAQNAPDKKTEHAAKSQHPAGSNATLNDPTARKSRNTNMTDVYALNEDKSGKKPKPTADAHNDSQAGADSRGPRQTVSLDGTMNNPKSGPNSKDAAAPAVNLNPRSLPRQQYKEVHTTVQPPATSRETGPEPKPTPPPSKPIKPEPEAAH